MVVTQPKTPVSKSDIRNVKALLKLVDQHQVDQLIVGPIAIIKTRHTGFTPFPGSVRTPGKEGAGEPLKVPASDPPDSIEEIDADTKRMLGLEA